MDFNEANVICRLCLKKLTENCEPIEDIVQHALNFLTLSPKLTVSDEPMMCETCAVNLKKCFDFKASCLSTEDCIASFAKVEDKKVDLRDIYSKVKLDGYIDRVPDDHSVCRFCLELVKNEASMSVRHDVDLIAMLQKYFLEMDLRITDDIIACRPCYNSLQVHVSFVNNYVSIEEKINEYCKVEGATYKGQVDLRDVATFISKSMLNVSNISSSITKEDKHENIVDNNVDIKIKFEDPTDVEEKNKEKLVDKEIQQNNSKSFQHDPSPPQSDCVPQLTRATNKRMYRCDLCNHEAKRKFDLKRHILTHKPHSETTMYKCDQCDYKATRKSTLNTHKLTHKTRSELTIYKCETCTYETKHKRDMQRHVLIHRDVSEIEMHKCDVCSFKTKWSGSFRYHLLSHRNTPDVLTRVTMYKCDLCDHEAKTKSHLKRHMLTHKPHSEITMYKCDSCDHETKHKSDLKRHMLTHKPHSEIAVYKCDLCQHESKRKSDLKIHMLTHKPHSEIAMYKCDLCDHESKRKFDLNRHMLTHKPHSEVTMYKCETCDYETKHKDCLKRHVLIHMDGSKIEMHKCEVCSFEAKWKNALRKHLLSHRNTGDVVT